MLEDRTQLRRVFSRPPRDQLPRAPRIAPLRSALANVDPENVAKGRRGKTAPHLRDRRVAEVGDSSAQSLPSNFGKWSVNS